MADTGTTGGAAPEDAPCACGTNSCMKCVLKHKGDERADKLESVLASLSRSGEEQQFRWTYDLKNALNLAGPFAHQAPALAMMVVECGAIPAIIQLLKSPYDFVPYNAACVLKALSQIDDLHALDIVIDGGAQALVELSKSGHISTQRHAAANALSMLGVAAARCVRDGRIPDAEPWIPLIELTRFNANVLIQEVQSPSSSQNHQCRIIRPSGSEDDVIEYAPRFSEILKESAGQALTSLVMAMADVNVEKLHLLKSDSGPPLLDCFGELLTSPIPSIYQQSVLRYTAAQSVACLCHTPPQLDVNDPNSTTRKVFDMLLQSNLPRALLRALDGLVRETPSVRDRIFAELNETERKTAELLSTDTVLLVVDAICNLSMYPHIARSLTDAIPLLLSIVRATAQVQDAEVLAQQNSHFKTLGCTTRALPFHVTHFAASAHYGALQTLASIGHATGDRELLAEIQSPALLAERRQAAKLSKEAGNDCFKVCDFESALWRYTRAARLHPDTDGTLAIYYSNRSECYMQMRMYPEALSDAERALTLDPSHSKSISRKERALEGIAAEEKLEAEQRARERQGGGPGPGGNPNPPPGGPGPGDDSGRYGGPPPPRPGQPGSRPQAGGQAPRAAPLDTDFDITQRIVQMSFEDDNARPAARQFGGMPPGRQ